MRKIFKDFLEENLTAEALNEPFDYKFNLDSTEEEFLKEYKKFLHIISNFFYWKDRLVTIINSYEIKIPKTDLEQIFKLYNYAKFKGNKVVERVIIEFLYTYYWGITNKEYKKNKNEAEQAESDFKQLLNEFSLKKAFFSTVINDLYEFYKELIEYGIKKDIYIQGDLIERIFNNMEKKKEKYNELIELFITNKKHIAHIINRDNEKEKHIDVYIEYIIDSLEHFGGYNCAKEMIETLNKENLLTEDTRKNIVNKYVGVVNNLCKNLKGKPKGFIKSLARINDLINELNFLLNKVNSFSEIQSNKLRECVRQVLKLKRFLLSDNDYVNSEMHKFENKIEIPKEEIEKTKQRVLDYVFDIYGLSRKDFIVSMGDALKMYSEYPLQSIVSRYSIDTLNQTYALNPEKVLTENNFKNLFDEIGEEYTRSHPELRNKLSRDYYEELLKYLSKTFKMQQQLSVLILGEDFNNIIDKLKAELKYDCKNDYATIINNIICIEKCIYQVVQNKGLETSRSGFENINKLVEIYKDDNDVVNGLMYLNYTLYEKSGLNLRNEAMHGTLIKQDVKVPLIVSFAGLIFASILLNAS